MAVTVNNAPSSLDELGVLLVLKAMSETKAKSATAYFTRTLNKLINQGLVISQDGRMVITEQAQSIMDTIDEGEKPTNLTALASQMREVYPAGEQPGTGHLWRCSVPTAVERLTKLIKKKNFSFTAEEAIEATKAYVNSYSNGAKIRTMQYFIFKNVIEDGEEVMKSELMEWIYRIRDGIEAQQSYQQTELSNFY